MIENVFHFHLDSEVGNVKKASSEKVVNKENASQMTSNAIFKPPVSKTPKRMHAGMYTSTNCVVVVNDGNTSNFEPKTTFLTRCCNFVVRFHFTLVIVIIRIYIL